MKYSEMQACAKEALTYFDKAHIILTEDERAVLRWRISGWAG